MRHRPDYHDSLVHDHELQRRRNSEAIHHRYDQQTLLVSLDQLDAQFWRLQLDAADIDVGIRDDDRPSIGIAMPIRLINLWRDRRGNAVIEFAFVAPVFIALMLGAVELGRMYYVRQSMEYATEQAARYYSVNPNAATTTVTSQLNGFLPGRISSGVTVSYADTLNCNGNSNVKCTTLTVTYPFSYAQSFLGFAGKTLTTTSQAVRQF